MVTESERRDPGLHRLARATAFTRCYLGGDHPPGDHLAAGQFPSPRSGPDYHAEPAAPDVPAISADVDSSQLSATQLPQVLGMHDASDRNHVGPCSRKPARGNQDLGRGQDAHHISMDTPGARAPPRPQGPRQRRRPPEKTSHCRRRTLTPPARPGFWQVTSGRSRMRTHLALSAAIADVIRKRGRCINIRPDRLPVRL